MTKITFLFFAAFFVLMALFAGLEGVSLSNQTIVAIFFIALVGIPHGAIDHIIFLEDGNSNSLKFYGFYFGMMSLYIAAWMFLPMWSMLLFLLLSAYHFGQSQFTELIKMGGKSKSVLYTSWGISILSGLIYYNHPEVVEIAKGAPDVEALLGAFDIRAYKILLPLSTIISLAILGYAYVKNQLSLQRLGMELYTLAFIHLVFYALPLVVGFTLYFVTLHSLKVLSEEFGYLREMRKSFDLKKFLKLLAPYTIVSVLGSALLLGLASAEILKVSNILLAFILISVLTLPHSFVMERFYERLRSTRALIPED